MWEEKGTGLGRSFIHFISKRVAPRSILHLCEWDDVMMACKGTGDFYFRIMTT
jgi:hypothetical protein